MVDRSPVRVLRPDVETISKQPTGSISHAPVRASADGETFVATTLSDGTWFASAATVEKCRTLELIKLERNVDQP